MKLPKAEQIALGTIHELGDVELLVARKMARTLAKGLPKAIKLLNMEATSRYGRGKSPEAHFYLEWPGERPKRKPRRSK